MIDFQTTPFSLATTIYHHAIEKETPASALRIIEGYFRLYRDKQPQFDLSKELTLIAAIAEVYTDDPINVLFQCGIVIFPEIFCINYRKLASVIVLSLGRLKQAMKLTSFMEFSNIHISFKQTLFRLGYTDSLDWNVFYLPKINDFSLHIMKHKGIVQTFPAELFETLSKAIAAFNDLYARREIISRTVSEAEDENVQFSKKSLKPKRHYPEKKIIPEEEYGQDVDVSTEIGEPRRSPRIQIFKHSKIQLSAEDSEEDYEYDEYENEEDEDFGEDYDSQA